MKKKKIYKPENFDEAGEKFSKEKEEQMYRELMKKEMINKINERVSTKKDVFMKTLKSYLADDD